MSAAQRVIISWLLATIAVSTLAFLIDYISNPSNPVTWHIVSSFLIVITINLFFWLPTVIYLHKNNKVSLKSSVISSIASPFVGGASIIGIIILFFYVKEQLQQMDSVACQTTTYTDWTIGHIHYWQGIVSVAVLWAINGIIFFKLYGKFATNN